MIVGSGMLAKAFSKNFYNSSDIWIYAAGVSNSGCTNAHEFHREYTRLVDALNKSKDANSFVYFSTCSINDPEAINSDYVQHKIEMEKLVLEHPGFFIVRLSQVAGRTPNPHTLLNYIYARVKRSENFVIWKNAIRNIIDVDDIVPIVARLLNDPISRKKILNVANPVSYSIKEIVSMMEKVTGKKAVVDIINSGGAYDIDTSEITSIINEIDLIFDENYLMRVLSKYYT